MNNNIKLSIQIEEQELHINWMRDEDFAMIYTSDTTQMTRLDKLCENTPNLYELIEDTGRGKRYRCNDKTLISFRSKKRELTEEQKIKAGERMRKYQESKRS
jgi:sugar diacid utilization regulator